MHSPKTEDSNITTYPVFVITPSSVLKSFFFPKNLIIIQPPNIDLSVFTNHHPAAQTGPRPHLPMTDHTLPSSWQPRRMGKPYKAYCRMLHKRSRYTHQGVAGASAGSNSPFSFMLPFFSIRSCRLLSRFVAVIIPRLTAPFNKETSFVLLADKRGFFVVQVRPKVHFSS